MEGSKKTSVLFWCAEIFKSVIFLMFLALTLGRGGGGGEFAKYNFSDQGGVGFAYFGSFLTRKDFKFVVCHVIISQVLSPRDDFAN